MTSEGPKLTAEQIERQFRPLLPRFTADLEATATDPENLWALRRKMAKTLSYQVRGTPGHRRNLKRQKYAEQNGFCAICGDALPESGRYAELDGLKADEGYTKANTRLVHHDCHIADQQERGYA
jgi:hypothetical protein